MPIVTRDDVNELEDLRKRKAEFAKRDSVHVSASGRTTIAVELLEDGRAVVTIDRDSQRIHRIDVEREPV